MAARLGDYIDFRKDQIEKTMKELNKKKKREDVKKREGRLQ